MSISIHAPREGSDYNIMTSQREKFISIHAPREGSDELADMWSNPFVLFLSTLPARGATEKQ